MRPLILCACLSATSLVAGAQADPDVAAMQALVAQETAAWNAHDAAAFSARFAEDGSFTNIVGMQSFGRVPFLKQHQHIFSSIYRQSHVDFAIDRVKMLRPGVALVDVTSILRGYSELPPGMSAGPDGALKTKLLMVLTKERDGWMIAAFHNVAVYPVPPRP